MNNEFEKWFNEHTNELNRVYQYTALKILCHSAYLAGMEAQSKLNLDYHAGFEKGYQQGLFVRKRKDVDIARGYKNASISISMSAGIIADLIERSE
jgi:hypothetical protein